jgi:hypothetical protein
MKRLLLAASLLLAAGLAPARASVILYVTAPPPTLTIGQSVDLAVMVFNEGIEEINGFQINVAFSNWLIPGPPTETGYFADHGVFFFPGIVAEDSITFISDALAGDGGLGLGSITSLFKIPFTATQNGAPQMEVFDPVITLSDGSVAEIRAIHFLTPVVYGGGDTDEEPSPVPEPPTAALLGGALGGAALLRRRAGRRR